MKRKLILIALLLMLIPIGLVVAQSSANFKSVRFAQFSGGVSSSANYQANMVIGQPLAQTSQSTNYTISSGFLPVGRSGDTMLWLPLIGR